MDLESLVLVLVVVYLTECLVLVRRGALLCVRGWRDWSVVGSDGGLTTAQGSWRMLRLLPPFPTSYQSSLWLFSATETHLASWTSLSTEWAGRPPQTARLVEWEAVSRVEYDRRKVWVNGEVWFETRSDQESFLLAEKLTRLKGGSRSQRRVLLEEMMEGSLEVERLKLRRREVETAVRGLAVPAIFLLCYVVLVCPALIYTRGLSEVGWWLLGGLYGQSLLIAVMLFVRHRRLYPRLGDERFARVFSAALSPVSAMRAPDVVARHGLEGFHPWAVIRELCPAGIVREWCGRLVRDHVYPRLPEHPEGRVDLERVEGDMREGWVKLLKRELRGAGLDWEEMLVKPLPTEEVNRVYCPRCLSQFVDEKARCAECGGRIPMGLGPWKGTS